MLSTRPVECPASLLRKCAALPAVATAVVNAGSEIVMHSCKLAAEEKLIVPTLVGNFSRIKKIAAQLAWDISSYRIIEAQDSVAAARIAVSLAASDEVASLMKGDVHTDQLLKAVIATDSGLLCGTRLSHVFHMSVPDSDSAICISDAVINVAPNTEIMLDIARNATSLLHSLGITEPKIAVLSATEHAMPSMPSSVQAAEVVKLASDGAIEGAVLGGPFAFDNAVSKQAAALKGIRDPVAGNADVLLMPNIETGNALFKMMVYYMSAAAAGLVLGAKVPITLTSRADPPAARLAATALATIYAKSC